MTSLRRSHPVIFNLAENLLDEVLSKLPLKVTESVEPPQIHRRLKNRALPLGDTLDVHPRRGVMVITKVLIEHLRKEKWLVLNEDILDHAS